MMTLNEIIGFMSPELANEILDDTFKEDKPLYKALSTEVAGALKVRPVFFEQKPRGERNKIILDMLTRPRMQASAATLLRGWLVKTETGMLSDFLDTLVITPEQARALEDKDFNNVRTKAELKPTDQSTGAPEKGKPLPGVHALEERRS